MVTHFPLHFLDVVPETRLIWTVKKSSQIYFLRKSFQAEIVACGVSAMSEFLSCHTSICNIYAVKMRVLEREMSNYLTRTLGNFLLRRQLAQPAALDRICDCGMSGKVACGTNLIGL